jgi:hypothetical protein
MVGQSITILPQYLPHETPVPITFDLARCSVPHDEQGIIQAIFLGTVGPNSKNPALAWINVSPFLSRNGAEKRTFANGCGFGMLVDA